MGDRNRLKRSSEKDWKQAIQFLEHILNDGHCKVGRQLKHSRNKPIQVRFIGSFIPRAKSGHWLRRSSCCTSCNFKLLQTPTQWSLFLAFTSWYFLDSYATCLAFVASHFSCYLSLAIFVWYPFYHLCRGSWSPLYSKHAYVLDEFHISQSKLHSPVGGLLPKWDQEIVHKKNKPIKTTWTNHGYDMTFCHFFPLVDDML